MDQFANSQYKIKLSHRMQQVAELVPRCKTVADVGCDHGYVSIELLKKGVVQKAIAMDVRQGPLERAILNAKLAGLEAVMECRLSDGVEKLEPGEADVIVIAGMGGMLMMDILEHGRQQGTLSEQMVLQPQSNIPRVRKYLLELGYAIEKEAFLQEEGKYYTVIFADKKKQRGESENKLCCFEKSDKSKKEADAVPLKNEKMADYAETKQCEYKNGCLKKSEFKEGYIEFNELFLQYGAYLLKHKNQVLYEYLNREYERQSQLLASLQSRKETGLSEKGRARLVELEHQMKLNQLARDLYKS